MKPYYEDGRATIYLGDCRDVIPMLALEESAVVTDPPYGIAIVKNGRIGGPGRGATNKAVANLEYTPLIGDDEPLDPTWLMAVGKRQIIWGANHFVIGIPSRGRLLVWDKRDGVGQNNFDDCEIAWDSKDAPVRLIRHLQMGMLHDGYGHGDRFQPRLHPTQKPVRVMSWCLSFLGDETPVVDPFMGSGTTLVAAKQLGKPVIGVEIDERYCEIAAKRLTQETLGLSA